MDWIFWIGTIVGAILVSIAANFIVSLLGSGISED